ncbi:MAG: tetratricopeptide repeat protein [Methylotenera sp.]
MKQEITLIKLFTVLFFISFNANAQDFSEKNAACNLALDKGNITNAIVIADEILKQESNNHNALLCKGRALGAQGKYNEALSTLELAAKQSKPSFDAIIAYLLIGNLHLDNKKYMDAIASYEKSLKISESENNNKFMLINHNLIGEAHAQNKDLNAALASYLAGSKLTKNDNERADSFERLGTTYSALGQHDLAIEYQLKGMLMQQKSGTLDQYANASLALGKVYEKAKEYANAEKIYTKFIQFAKDNGGAYYEAKASYELAQIKALSGDTANAKVLLTDALKIAKNTGEGDLATEIETSIKKLNN